MSKHKVPNEGNGKNYLNKINGQKRLNKEGYEASKAKKLESNPLPSTLFKTQLLWALRFCS